MLAAIFLLEVDFGGAFGGGTFGGVDFGILAVVFTAFWKCWVGVCSSLAFSARNLGWGAAKGELAWLDGRRARMKWKEGRASLPDGVDDQ